MHTTKKGTGMRCWTGLIILTLACWALAAFAAYQAGMLDGTILS